VAARSYLLARATADGRGAKVFNLCRSYRYQSLGYYVSLLAAARGQRPIPNIATIQDMKSAEIVRIRSDDLDELIQKSLSRASGKAFVLSIYFGRNIEPEHDRLCLRLCALFEAPLLRAHFVRPGAAGPWQLQRLSPISADEIPTHHHEFVVSAATEYFRGRRKTAARSAAGAPDLAILCDPAEAEPPSNPRAIRKFVMAARKAGMNPRVVDRDEYARLGEYDALFIRTMTSVNHYTYRFARRAQSKGLVVIDDPESIVRCTNKIYLAELMERHQVRTPRTLIVPRDGVALIAKEIGFPCVLKQPDGAFSQGVLKAENLAELIAAADGQLAKSELIVAQAYMPTEFDWRIGILNGVPLWACRYHMARSHWQIYRALPGGQRAEGRVEAVPIASAPRSVVRLAVRAAKLMGDGLYGVDLKVHRGKVYLVEVNDNPSINAGYEDRAEGDALYHAVMAVFARRIELARLGRTR